MPKQKLERSISIGFRVTQEERDKITSLMQQAGIRSVRAFFFKLINSTVIVRIDLAEIRELTKELRAIGINVNQLARRANETGSIYATDIQDIKSHLDGVWDTLDKALKSLAKL